MLTLLAGGTGTPKLLDGTRRLVEPAATTVVGNTGDDVELGGLLVCPDLDTVLFHGGGVLDRERWWGIDGDTTATHDEIGRLTAAAYPFADAFVLDERDPTTLDRPVVRTDTRIDGPDDAERVSRAALRALLAVGADVDYAQREPRGTRVTVSVPVVDED